MSVAVWLATIYGLTFTWHLTSPASGSTSDGGRLLIEIVIAVALAGILALPARRLKKGKARSQTWGKPSSGIGKRRSGAIRKPNCDWARRWLKGVE